MPGEDLSSGGSYETATHASEADNLWRRRSGRPCSDRPLRIGSDHNNKSRQFDYRGWQDAADIGDGTNDSGSLPAVKGTQGQVPAIRHSGTVRQRGAVHVRSQDTVLMRSPMTQRRRMLQAPFGRSAWKAFLEKAHAANSSGKHRAVRGANGFDPGQDRGTRRSLGQGLLPQPARRHSGWKDAAVLRRPDQGQGRGDQL